MKQGIIPGSKLRGTIQNQYRLIMDIVCLNKIVSIFFKRKVEIDMNIKKYY